MRHSSEKAYTHESLGIYLKMRRERDEWSLNQAKAIENQQNIHTTKLLIYYCSNRFNEFFLLLRPLLDENDIALVPLNFTKSRTNNLHHSHQHIFQHQSSDSSTASVQTVFHNVDAINNGDHHNSNTINHNTNNITATSNNQMILLGTSSSSASFQSANGTAYSVHTNGGSMGK